MRLSLKLGLKDKKKKLGDKNVEGREKP